MALKDQATGVDTTNGVPERPSAAQPVPVEDVITMQTMTAPAAEVSQDAPIRPPAGRHLRADLQGLRGIAVAGAVLLHFCGWPSGGFTGADIFFVLSGYLITGNLQREFQRSGTISLKRFYQHRVRRILPSALVVAAVTLVVSRLLFNTPRLRATEHDGLWATLFAANWRFNKTGTDYFTGQAPSPFQHYWSLSVEEQFYFVWPLALLVILWIVARLANRHAGLIAAPIAAALCSAVSLAYAFSASVSDPNRAYFSSLSRIWEIGTGALLASLVPHLRASRHIRQAMSAAGVAVILFCYFTMSGGAPGFPAPGALLPIFGAALIIAGGSTGVSWRPLSHPALVRLGDMSYSVYLCHFPVIIFADSLIPAGGWRRGTTTALVIAATSLLLFTFVEKPLRQASWSLHRARRRQQPSRLRRHAVVLAATALATVGVGVQLIPGVSSYASAAPTAVFQLAPSTVPGVSTAARLTLAGQIAAAAAAHSWPQLAPTLDSEIAGPQASPAVSACATTTLQPAAMCTFGDRTARHTIYLVGDSTAVVSAAALIDIVAATPGWNLRVGAAFGCRFDAVPLVSTDPVIEKTCPAHNEAVVADINRTRPSLVVITNAYTQVISSTTHRTLSATAWASAVGAEIARIRSAAGAVAVISSPPADRDIEVCYGRFSSPGDCLSHVTAQRRTYLGADASLAGGRVHFVDATPWYCTPTGECPSFVGHTPVKLDTFHTTQSYEQLIAPAMREQLQAQGLLPL